MELFKDYWLASLHLAQLDSSCWMQSLQLQPLLRQTLLVSHFIYLDLLHWQSGPHYEYIYIYIWVGWKERNMASIGSCKNSCHLFCDGRENKNLKTEMVFSICVVQVFHASNNGACSVGGYRAAWPLFTNKWRTNRLHFKQVFNTVGLLPFSILCIQLSWQIIHKLLWVMEAHFRSKGFIICSDFCFWIFLIFFFFFVRILKLSPVWWE